MIKRLTEILPLLTIVLIYAGYCNIHFYYQEFDIDIFSFIDNGEIILSFLPAILSFLGDIGTKLPFLMIIFFLIKPINNYLKELPEEKHEVILNRIGISLILYIILLAIVLRNNFTDKYMLYKYQDIVYITILFITTFALVYYNLMILSLRNNNYHIIVTLFIILFGINSFYHTSKQIEAQRIKLKSNDKLVKFIYNNKVIATGLRLTYIGQSKSHFFIYDRKNKKTLVYKKDDISEIEYYHRKE